MQVWSLGEADGKTLHYSCLKNSMDRGAWRATVHGVAKSQTQLRDWTELIASLVFISEMVFWFYFAFLNSFVYLSSFSFIKSPNLLHISNWALHSHAKSLQSCLTLWTVALQAPLSIGFSRQEYWSGMPCPPPGDLIDQGIKPAFPTLAGRYFTTVPPGKPNWGLVRMNDTHC